VRVREGYLFWTVGDQAFHVHHADPRVRVLGGTDGLIHGMVEGDTLVRLWVPKELMDAA
jgi:hypothetical protein